MSVPFPQAPEKGTPYSIWTFDGQYWLLTPDEGGGNDGGGGGASTWAELNAKPEPIEKLGNANEIAGNAYSTRQGIPEEEAPEFWSKHK